MKGELFLSRFCNIARQNKAKLIYRMDEYYLFTPPEQFIYSHLPNDVSWVLCDSKIKTNFENNVFLKPAYFQSGFTGISEENAVISASSQLEIILEHSQSRGEFFDYSFKLTKESGKEECLGWNLSQYGMLLCL